MSFYSVKDFLFLDKDSEILRRQFEAYCEWCWGHGYGNCDICRKEFNKVYRPIRIKELTEKYKTKDKL